MNHEPFNNDPARIEAALRSFAVYSICAVLAIVIGVMMTNPWTYSSLGFIAIICCVPLIPILMRWHHPLLILCWNTPIMMFFLKGDPNLFLVMIAISLGLSILEQTLNQPRFIKIPQITWPLICLTVVVLITAKLNGGIGLRAFGSDVYGGKKYIFLILAILGYFAIVSRPIPLDKARLYVALYFLGASVGIVADFYPITPHFLSPIFWLIPPSSYSISGLGSNTRLAGVTMTAQSIIWTLMACYGLRGIFLSNKLWRPCLFFLAFFLMLFGGFRSTLIITATTFVLQFYLEGLHRTKLAPFFLISFLAIAGAVVPLAPKLPYTFQRSMAFLPESMVHLSNDARLDAQDSWDWRLELWGALLPQIPKHLLLGKGYAITMEDFDQIAAGAAMKTADAGQQDLALSSDYHNGYLSVILPFGIWGAIAFIWFMGSSLWVVYCNFRYGDYRLRTLNTFLFCYYFVACVTFFGGSLATNFYIYTGLIGMSIGINGGVSRAPARRAKVIPFYKPIAPTRLQPQAAFKR